MAKQVCVCVCVCVCVFCLFVFQYLLKNQGQNIFKLDISFAYKDFFFSVNNKSNVSNISTRTARGISCLSAQYLLTKLTKEQE